MSISTPLDGEIAQLRSELAKDARFARLQHLERLRQDYLSLPAVPTANPQFNSESATSNGSEPDARSPGRRRTPEREEALREARSFLSGKTDPTRITDIDAHLTERGIRLGGNDPLNNLSALLSTSGQFTAHGRAGWTLSQ